MILFGKKAKSRSTETEEQKAARKQAEKEAAIAAYKEKRQLTLKRFFEIAGLPFPEKFEALADHPVSDFTADPRRLTPGLGLHVLAGRAAFLRLCGRPS